MHVQKQVIWHVPKKSLPGPGFHWSGYFLGLHLLDAWPWQLISHTISILVYFRPIGCFHFALRWSLTICKWILNLESKTLSGWKRLAYNQMWLRTRPWHDLSRIEESGKRLVHTFLNVSCKRGELKVLLLIHLKNWQWLARDGRSAFESTLHSFFLQCICTWCSVPFRWKASQMICNNQA